MQKNRLGKSDIYISDHTLGCMSLGTDELRAKYIIDYALDRGINHFDTADLYDFGLNEEVVGKALKDKRRDIILTSKVGNNFDALTKDWFWDPSKEHIINGVKDSLNRLQTDYIDFYMLHGGTIEDNIDESIAAFESLKKEGLIRTYGISSIRPNVIREYVKHSSIDGVMLQYSLFDRRGEENILDLLHEHGISVLARGPLAKGMLSDKGLDKINNKGKNGFLDYGYDELKQTFKNIQSHLPENMSMNTASLQYVLKHPAIVSVVFGASSIEQVKENTDISPVISDTEYDLLKSLTHMNKYEKHR